MLPTRDCTIHISWFAGRPCSPAIGPAAHVIQLITRRLRVAVGILLAEFLYRFLPDFLLVYPIREKNRALPLSNMVKRKRPPNEETKMCVQFVFKIRNNKSFSSRHRPKILNNKRNKKPKIILQDNKEKSRNIGLKERILQAQKFLEQQQIF